MTNGVRIPGGLLAAAAALSLTCGGSKETGPSVGPVAAIVLDPNPLSLSSIGATRQLADTAKDASGHVVAGASVSFTITSHGAATVSPAGLVTALAAGTDTVIAASGAARGIDPVVVTQRAAAIVVIPATATLYTQGRTVRLSAAATDSTGHAISGLAVTWRSSDTAVARVDTSGLVTAVANGSSQVTASAEGATGNAAVTVSRYPVGVSVVSASGRKLDTLTALGATLGYSGTATDSSGATIAGQVFSWLSRRTAVATVSPSSGASTTAKAAGNGSTTIVGTAGAQSDSATLVDTIPAGTGVSVTVGDNFFRSAQNGSQNPAVDTIAAGGTVTWTWTGSNSHSVQSTGTPSFTSSVIQTAGTYSVTFTTAGTYTYDCAVHGTIMTGTVVVQ